MHQLRFGVGGGNSGELLQAPFLFAEEFLELLLALSEGFFAVAEALDTFRRLALSLLEKIILAIELALAVLYLALFALDFFATAADLDLPFLTELHQLFFAAEDGCLAQAFRFALCFANDSRGFLYLIDQNNRPQVYADVSEAFPYGVYNRLESVSSDSSFIPNL